jgi:hypothetical protein
MTIPAVPPHLLLSALVVVTVSDHHEIIRTEIDGQPVLVVRPTICEADPPRVREGIARRRLVELTGVCPCGARLTLVRTTAQFAYTEVRHASNCPALNPWNPETPR